MSKGNGIDFEADKSNEFESTDLDSLSVHISQMQELQIQIEVSEKQTKALKEKFNKINSEVIPNILAEQGLKSLKLADGTTIEVNKKYSCTLPKDPEKKAAAYKWLRDQGLGDIIKNESGLDMPSDVFHLFVKDETKMKR